MEAAVYLQETPVAVQSVVQAPVSDAIFQPIDSITPLLYHDGGVSPWLWGIPLVAGGIIAAASGAAVKNVILIMTIILTQQRQMPQQLNLMQMVQKLAEKLSQVQP